MKKSTAKKKAVKRPRTAGPSKSEESPMEFDKGWQELDAQYERQKMDFNSLAAQLGINSKDKLPEE
ncbi:MAG: hypothetical protein WC881_07795 [Elusimicrobiota bacterium]